MRIRKRTNLARSISIALLALLIMVGMGTNVVSATASISPNTSSALIGMEASYTVTGLAASTAYDIKLDTAEVLSDITSTTSGQLVFSVSSSVAGTFTVGVYNQSAVLECSAILVVTDLMATIMPPMVIMIGFTILFGIIKELRF